MARLSLEKILQGQGFGTRRYCRGLILAGEVRCDGQVWDDPQAPFDDEDLLLYVQGVPWRCRHKVYLALHKPAGYECSRKPSHHPGVLSLLPPIFSLRGVQAVGRLDHDTTGLLLLSDDGAFIHAHTSPRRHVPKVYQAQTADPVDALLVQTLLSGVQLHDEPAPLRAQTCSKQDEHVLEIVLEQGKYHQVKRMLAAAGNHCSALHRSQIGGLRLDELNLQSGQWCYLEELHLHQLRD